MLTQYTNTKVTIQSGWIYHTLYRYWKYRQTDKESDGVNFLNYEIDIFKVFGEIIHKMMNDGKCWNIKLKFLVIQKDRQIDKDSFRITSPPKSKCLSNA